MALRIVRRLFGFSVENDRGVRVTAELEPWRFVLQDPRGGFTSVGIPGQTSLVNMLASMLAVAPRSRRRATNAANRIDPGLQREIACERERLLGRIPAEAVRVHDAVAAATGKSGGIHDSPAFYARPYLVKDVLNFRAAAIAVGYAAEVPDRAADGTIARHLDALEQWPALFSPSGIASRSLRRTLANLPATVPADIVWELRDVELSRPVTSAVELSAICLSARLRSRADAGQLQRILLDAREEEITRALERVGRQLAVPDDAAAIDLERVLRYLADMPEPHCGRLGGLVAKAIEWHRAWNRRSLAEALAAAGFQSTEGILDVPTRRPPFALPDVSGIRFLRTVEDVALEGQRMNHCVVTRARAALRGDCDLFHVEHQGEQATVELSKHGNVIEAGGPRNLRNRAVTWGRDVLREWWRTSSRIGGDGGSPEVLLLPSGKAAQRRGCFDARRDEWALAVRTLRSAGGDEPDWLADLERFRAKVVADESAPRRAARRPAGRTSTG